MSVLGYFGRRLGELRMPREAAGIRMNGEVLEGKKSVELARALAAIRAAKLPASGREGIRVEDYDPVLRAHCRLD
jgi:hypothetical protein